MEQMLPCQTCGQVTAHRPTPPDGWMRCYRCVPPPGMAMQYPPPPYYPPPPPPVQTIERTGKEWKGTMLIGGATFLGGIGVAAGTNYQTLGAAIAVIGAIAYVYGKAGAWWLHG